VPAGGQDDGREAVPHQLLRGLQGRVAKAADDSLGSAGQYGRRVQDVGGFGDAVLGGRVGRKDHRVASLEGYQRLEDRGAGGIRRRNDAGNHPHGHGDLIHLLGRILGDHADGLQIPDILEDLARGEGVLRDLVLDPAEAGLLHRQPGQFLGVGQRLPRDRLHHAIHLFLAEFGKTALGVGGQSQQVAHFLHRHQVLI